MADTEKQPPKKATGAGRPRIEGERIKVRLNKANKEAMKQYVQHKEETGEEFIVNDVVNVALRRFFKKYLKKKS